MTSYLLYIDCYNLYGNSMMQSLPFSYGIFQGGRKFEAAARTESELLWRVHPENSRLSYFFEVDLESPRQLHDEHKDLPFLPEHRDGKLIRDDIVREAQLYCTLHHTRISARPWYAPARDSQSAAVSEKKNWLRPCIAMNTRMRDQSKN